jgi:hypothetical protein
LTYNAWNLFSDACPDEINRQQQFHVYESDEWSYEPRQLFSITDRLAKLNTSFVTLLCVRDFSLTFDHLKALLNIPTLAALVLEQARPGGVSEITARHFMDFGRAAREKSALQKLRLLIMCDFGIGRKAVLDALSGFPCLQLIGLQNSKTSSATDMPQQAPSNWKLLTTSEYAALSVDLTMTLLTSCRLESCSLSPSEFDPQSLWTASYLTSSRKLQRLYSLTQTLAQSPHEEDEQARSVCITYGGWANRSIHEATAWFIRDLEASSSKTSEQIQPAAVPQEKAGNVAKKRKIRTGKQMDVGCLLGAFK